MQQMCRVLHTCQGCLQFFSPCDACWTSPWRGGSRRRLSSWVMRVSGCVCEGALVCMYACIYNISVAWTCFDCMCKLLECWTLKDFLQPTGLCPYMHAVTCCLNARGVCPTHFWKRGSCSSMLRCTCIRHTHVIISKYFQNQRVTRI
jgi:hypothetical protein